MLLSMMNFWTCPESPRLRGRVGVPTALVARPAGSMNLCLAPAASPWPPPTPRSAPRIELNLLAEGADLDRLVAAFAPAESLGSSAMRPSPGRSPCSARPTSTTTDASGAMPAGRRRLVPPGGDLPHGPGDVTPQPSSTTGSASTASRACRSSTPRSCPDLPGTHQPDHHRHRRAGRRARTTPAGPPTLSGDPGPGRAEPPRPPVPRPSAASSWLGRDRNRMSRGADLLSRRRHR